MVNFVVVIDPDPGRRSHFIQTIKPLLPPVEGLITNSCATKDFHAIWAANPNAPVSYIADQEGAAVIWGEAIIQGKSTRLDAPGLKTVWKDSQYTSFPPFDGFYAAVVYHPHFGIAVGADLLGLFPIYYYVYKDVLLVGSSQELFRYHPLFRAKFNPAGLVGIFLTNGLFEGQTLWQDVRRLGAGHLLVWLLDNSPKELKQYQLPTSTQNHPYTALSFAEQVDILEKAFDQAVLRHAPKDQQYTLLLSGGLDSRMLAGFLHYHGVDTTALTLGIKSDLEMKCAIPVARELSLEHHITNIPLKQYPHYADLLVKWEHLANGYNCIMDWGIQERLRNLAPRVVAGYAIYLASPKAQTFDGFFAHRLNSLGLSPQLLERLLRKEVFGDLVQEILAKIRSDYESYSDEDYLRGWWFEIYYRGRFHVGCAGWQLCFGAWPVLPILDWQFLKTTAVLPPQMMDNRRGQEQLLSNRFPELACFPLDHNDYHPESLSPNKIRQQWPRLFRLQRKLQCKLGHWQQKLGIERRYYYRTYDINNAGWRAVRQQVEPYRERVQHLFHSEVLNELLPSPDVPLQFRRDPITEASGIKAMLGFLLWSKQHL